MPYTTYEGETPTVISTGSNSEGMGFGGGWWGLVALVAVASIFGGGWGFGGGFGGGNGALTRADLCEEMGFQEVQAGIRNISDSVNVGFANLNSTICNQQYDTARMIDSLGMNMMQGFNTANVTALTGFNGVQAQLAQCCCDIERGIERLGCQSASETAAMIQASTNNTQRILDYLCSEKISALQTENAVLAGQLSQNAQTNAIISALAPKAPIPAYPVFPTTSFAYPTGVAFGVSGLNGYNNGSCGCCTTNI